MKSAMKIEYSSTMRARFLEQYSTEETIRKYTRKTAGYGISYLLDHDYGRLYLDVIERYVPKARLKAGICLWEFGCGAGMNLLHLVSVLERRGISVELACGTDFSAALIAAARGEASNYVTE